MPEIGDIFDGAYRIDAIAGSGGFARVYVAEELASERRVALKILTPRRDGTYDATDAARFQRELKALARLRSPNTVALYTYGTSADGLLYAVFEFLQGRELAEVLAEKGSLSPVVAEHIFRQLLNSLDEAHRNNILHRDIKPENVLITPEPSDPWHAKLIDFGIARPFEQGSPSVTRTGELLGTPRYMSPEQLTSKPLTPASDLYSLGMVAFEMLAGRESLAGGSIGAQIERMHDGHRFDASQIPGVRTGLSDTIARMTSREVEARPQSVRAVRTMLNGSRVGASVSREAPRQAPPPSTNRVTVGLMLLLGLGLVAALAWLRLRADEPKPVPPSRAITSPRPTPPPQVERTADVGSIDLGEEDESASEGCLGGKPLRSSPNLYVPDDVNPQTPLPLIILLHERGGTGASFLEKGGFIEVAKREKAIIFSPQSPRKSEALHHIWAPTNWDKGMGNRGPIPGVLEEVGRIMRRNCVDRHRIFVVGHEWGSEGANRLMCLVQVAAAAFISDVPIVLQKHCPNGAGYRPSLIRFSSSGERAVGTDGSKCGPREHRATINANDEAWAAAGKCTTDDPPFPQGAKTGTRTWECEADDFESHLVDGGPGWPSIGRSRLAKPCHPPPGDYPYVEQIWEFFDRQGARVPED